MATSNDNHTKNSSASCNNGWIECFCICSFDIELGQKIDNIYPSHYNDVLTPSQQSDIAYLAFPEGSATTGKPSPSAPVIDIQNTKLTFRISSEEMPIEPDDDDPAVNNESSTFSSSSSSDYLFGHVYFRQRKDTNVQRGYVMKSVVLITKLPFLKLYRFLITKIAELYFAKPEHADELFELVYTAVNKWDIPMPDAQFDLPFMGQRIMYRSPVFTPCKSNSILINEKAKQQITLAIPSTKATEQRSKSPHRKKEFDKSGLSPSTPLKERLLGRKYPFQHEINLFSTFRKHVANNNLVKYWELVISGEPILVLSSNPTQCCDAVLALASMIAPIHYAGDYRPYLTVHNSDFKLFAAQGETDEFSACIVGTTNPFFIKAFEKWPNIIVAGNGQNTGAKSKSPSNDEKKNIFSMISNPLTNKKKQNEEKRKQLMWDSEETFWTSRTNFVVKPSFQISDNTWIHLNTNLLFLDVNDKNKDSADGVNNEQIRKFFEELTEAFLAPIHRCFDTLVCSMKTFIVTSEHPKVFKPERFLTYIEKHGYNEQLFEGKRADVLDLYKRFIYSKNFISWMQQRILDAYYNDVLHTDISMLLRDVSEVGMIDLFLRLKEELEREKKCLGITSGDPEVIKRLQLFLQQILQCLPSSLSDNLLRQIDNFVPLPSSSLTTETVQQPPSQEANLKTSHTKSKSTSDIDDYFM